MSNSLSKLFYAKKIETTGKEYAEVQEIWTTSAWTDGTAASRTL